MKRKIRWVVGSVLTVFLLCFACLTQEGVSRLAFIRLTALGIASLSHAYHFTLSGELSMGCGGFVALGAYLSAFLFRQLGGSAIWLAPVGAILFPMFVASLFGRVVLPFQGNYLSLATLGFGEIIRIFFENFPYLGGASGLFGLPHWTKPIFCVAGLLFFSLGCRASLVGKTGLQGRAVAGDSLAASASGIKVQQVKRKGFCVMAAGCGFAGFLIGGAVGFLHPTDFGYLFSCDILTAVVLGQGSLFGSLLAGVCLEGVNLAFSGIAVYKLLLYGLGLICLPYLTQAWNQGKGRGIFARTHLGRKPSLQAIWRGVGSATGEHSPLSRGDGGDRGIQRGRKNDSL